MCIRMGGSITGEHGVGMEKRDFCRDVCREPTWTSCAGCAARSIRWSMANRGKMFPSGEAPALHFTGLHPLEAGRDR